MKTGKRYPQGNINGDVWQKIYELTVPQQDDDLKLLIQGQGANTSKSHAITFVGTAQLDKSYSVLGHTSLMLDGNSDYLTIPDHADWNFGSGDFTMDLWAKRNDAGEFGSFWYQGDNATTGTDYVYWNIGSDGQMRFKAESSGVTQCNYVTTDASDDVNWHHYAVVRNGSNLYIFEDGVSLTLTEDTAISTNTLPDVSDSVEIGRFFANVTPTYYYLGGWIDEMRISKGIARWTSAFTPSTQQHEADVYDVLLLHLDGADTDTATNDVSGGDSSQNRHIVTYNGTAQLDTDQSKFDGSSIYFDGNSDTLTMPDSTSWDVAGSNSDSWTIDFWARHSGHGGTDTYLCQYEDATNYWYMSHNTSSGINFAVSNGSEFLLCPYTAAGKITDNDWHHIAMCKAGNEWGVYLDGNQVNYDSTNTTDTLAGILLVGNTGWGSNYMEGNMANIRFSNSNIFSAAPNATPDDTITIPTSAPDNYIDYSKIHVVVDGDTDKKYKVVTRMVNDYNGAVNYRLELNLDQVIGNYGFQSVYGIGASIYAQRAADEPGFPIGYNSVLGDLCQGKTILHAKSGYNRTLLTDTTRGSSGTTVDQFMNLGESWTNTSDNITKLTVATSLEGGNGAGSYVAFYSLMERT